LYKGHSHSIEELRNLSVLVTGNRYTYSLSDLKIAVNGWARTSAWFLNTNAGMLSDPVALLALTLSNAFKVVHTLITY